MKLQDLQPFCSRDETRTDLLRPWRYPDGMTYASDGSIAIRATVDGSEVPPLTAPNIPMLFADIPLMDGAVWYPLPDLPDGSGEAEICPACRGNARLCEVCRGDGEVTWEYRHYTMRAECPACNGDSYCQECKGVGHVTDRIPIPVAGLRFNAHYLRLLSRLPGPVEIALPDAAGGVARFRFAGGDGLLVPIREV